MRVKMWAKDRILTPRWLLASLYMLFVLLGTSAIVAGVPTLMTVADSALSFSWGVGMVAGSVVAMFGSFAQQLLLWERIGDLILLIGLSVLLTGMVLRGANPFGIGLVVVVSSFPLARFLPTTHRSSE